MRSEPSELTSAMAEPLRCQVPSTLSLARSMRASRSIHYPGLMLSPLSAAAAPSGRILIVRNRAAGMMF